MSLVKVALGLCALLVTCQDTLDRAEFQKLHESLCPKSSGKWQTIPWRVNLLEARAAALEAGKPLFMWSMNGHPLGCV